MGVTVGGTVSGCRSADSTREAGTQGRRLQARSVALARVLSSTHRRYAPKVVGLLGGEVKGVAQGQGHVGGAHAAALLTACVLCWLRL